MEKNAAVDGVTSVLLRGIQAAESSVAIHISIRLSRAPCAHR